MSFYKSGTLLLSSAQNEASDQLWLISNDSFPLDNRLMEGQSTLAIDGRVWALEEIPYTGKLNRLYKESFGSMEAPLLAVQHAQISRKFVVISAQVKIASLILEFKLLITSKNLFYKIKNTFIKGILFILLIFNGFYMHPHSDFIFELTSGNKPNIQAMKPVQENPTNSPRCPPMFPTKEIIVSVLYSLLTLI